jgi:hypothetical protein
MNKITINIISLAILMTLMLSSCFKEKEPIFENLGPVATIPVFTLSKTTADPGETITLRIRYYSENIEVRQLRFNAIRSGNSTNVATVNVSNFNINNSYEETFSYTIPGDASGSVIALQVEIETTNGNVNRRQANVTVR